MFFTVFLLAVVFSLVVFLVRGSSTDPCRLTEGRLDIVTTGVQIICGDCSGESRLPVKTYLDKNGNCSQCGGQSYILAANCALRIQALIGPRMSQLAENNDKKVAFLAANPVGVQKRSRLPC